MLVALGWWSYLLYLKNNDAFLAKAELLKITKIAERQINSIEDFQLDSDFVELQRKYNLQEKMILGEAAVLALTLFIGIWFINNGYQKQTKAARQSRNFLLSITHELKSPLASIKLILQTFSKRKLNQDQIQTFSSNAIKETERLEGLVNNLLLAAKMETTFDIQKEEIDLFMMTDGIIEHLSNKTPNLIINNSIKPNTHIIGDAFGLNAVLSNLLENAIKYSDNAPNLNINHQRTNNFDIVSISDAGLGIPDSEKKLVFDKFYRVGNEDTRKTKGTGLGLYIVKQIIDKHKGQIKVENNIPNGSIFTFSIPHLKLEA